ncbi:BBE domain-containing protein [Chromobacterium alticapitis]|uniref:BBE domain-containing protein n=1 Tax=Chromobacterium alticapitis TaxID=2073169 RepID=UPI0018ECB582|nr:BBE domain-containing protein [Chromobacterium alticapitis]
MDLSQTLLQVDSCGGAINHAGSGNNGFNPDDNRTAVPQRASIMKLQYQSYWTDPEQDQAQVRWMREFYEDVYRQDGFNGTPYPGPASRYEGCYINYPDVDMVDGANPGTPAYHWGELYYPGAYGQLREGKRRYDPLNVFHHALSIQPA